MDSTKPPMHGRDHRPGGSDPIPGLGNSGWTVVTSFTNSWSDANALAPWPSGQDPSPVSWMRTSTGQILVRGSLGPGNGSWGKAAFDIPYNPDNAMRFVCQRTSFGQAVGVVGQAYGNDGWTDVVIDDGGHIIPMRPVHGGFPNLYGYGNFATVAGTAIGPGLTGLAAENNFAPYREDFHNTVGAGIEYYNGIGAYGFAAAAAPYIPGPSMCLRFAEGPFSDQQVEVKQVAATSVGLGLRLQAPYYGGSIPYPAGYIAVVRTGAGNNMNIYAVQRGGQLPSVAGPVVSPGFVAGDVVKMTAIGNEIAVYKNADPVPIISGYDEQYKQGYAGFGFNGALGVKLIENVLWGWPEDLKSGIVSLDNISYKSAV